VTLPWLKRSVVSPSTILATVEDTREPERDREVQATVLVIEELLAHLLERVGKLGDRLDALVERSARLGESDLLGSQRLLERSRLREVAMSSGLS
jgi:hypothetical protein